MLMPHQSPWDEWQPTIPVHVAYGPCSRSLWQPTVPVHVVYGPCSRSLRQPTVLVHVALMAWSSRRVANGDRQQGPEDSVGHNKGNQVIVAHTCAGNNVHHCRLS